MSKMSRHIEATIKEKKRKQKKPRNIPMNNGVFGGFSGLNRYNSDEESDIIDNYPLIW